jgi:transcriptional regulator with XRE-family HTH domain
MEIPFCDQLRVMRAVRNLNQQDLAQASGIPNTYISLLESGKTLPSVDWDARLRAALKWPPRGAAQMAFEILFSEIDEATLMAMAAAPESVAVQE